MISFHFHLIEFIPLINFFQIGIYGMFNLVDIFRRLKQLSTIGIRESCAFISIRQVIHEDIKENGTQNLTLWDTLHYSFQRRVLSTQSNALLSVA